MNIMDIVSQYWGIGAVIVVGGVYVLTHKKLAINFAKKKIHALMLAAEKGAEQLFLDNGQAKLQWVIDKGYDFMPAPVRLFISKPLFATLVQALFNDAKGIIEAHRSKEATIIPNIAAESIAPLAPIEQVPETKK